MKNHSVLFVCLGNICRSPMAEVIIAAKLADAGLADNVRVTSSGIGKFGGDDDFRHGRAANVAGAHEINMHRGSP